MLKIITMAIGFEFLFIVLLRELLSLSVGQSYVFLKLWN